MSRSAKRNAMLISAMVVGVALAIGLAQTGDSNKVKAPANDPSLAQLKAKTTGAPKPLAELYEQSSQLLELDRGQTRKLLRKLRGYPVVMNVWASNCAPCREEFPILRAATAKYAKRVAFIGLDVGESKSRAAAFLKEQPTLYPSILDPKSDVAAMLEVGLSLPQTVIFDSGGKVAIQTQGSYPTLERLVQDIERYAK